MDLNIIHIMFCVSKSQQSPECETFDFERTKAHPLRCFFEKEVRGCYCAAHRSMQSEQMKIFVFEMYFSVVVY